MSKLKALPDIVDDKTEISHQTVEALQIALDKAKRGELTEIVITGLSSDGGSYTAWSGTMNATLRVALIEQAKFDWLMSCYINSDD